MTCQISTIPVAARTNSVRGLDHGDRLTAISDAALVDPVGEHARRSGARTIEGANMSAITIPSWSGVPPSSRTSHGCATDLHPGADEAADLPEPVDPVVAVPHRGESAAEAARLRADDRSAARIAAARGAREQLRDASFISNANKCCGPIGKPVRA